MTDTIKFAGKLFLNTSILIQTGLHIGTSSEGMEIGGVDNPVIRDSITKEPYIPGSSLRGKLRSLLEKNEGAIQNRKIGQAYIHVCEDINEFVKCPVCKIFGVSGDLQKHKDRVLTTSRLLVRDVKMTAESKYQLEDANINTLSEIKWEVAIDRITSAASPRNIERVPAGTVFSPSEMVFTLYDPADLQLFAHVVEGLQLLEDDYLGGSGSRGSGKVVFKDINLYGRGGADYTQPHKIGAYDSVQALADALKTLTYQNLFS